MGSDEENLDELLKSIMSGEEETNSLESDKEDTGAEAVSDDFDLGDFTADDFAANDFEIGNFAADDFSSSDFDLGGFAADDFATDDFAADDFAIDDFAADDFAADDFVIEDFGAEEAAASAESQASAMPMEETSVQTEETQAADDLEALFAMSDAAEPQEAAFTGSEAVNEHMDPEDMLALLEGMSEEHEETGTAVSSDGESTESEESKKLKGEKKKKGRFSLFSGKKNKETKADAEIFIPTEENLESLFDAAEAAATEEESVRTDLDEAVGKGKKGGFFSKVFAFLTETDDDESEEGITEANGMEPSDENKNILEELEEEDKKKKKKKVKGKKGQAEELSEDEDEDGKESAKSRKKEKRRKDKKSKEESPEQIIRESVTVKKVSKKNIAIIAGLCLTITAVIVVLCSIVPGFFDKRKAREAYYQSDYGNTYELLYGKQLDNSDTIIFNKSKIILEMDRKLKSYHNYMGIGKEVQALDALMAGVEKYPDILLHAEEYHVEAEVNAIYETILNILSDKYDISEAAAKVIIDYDDLTYTRKLESVVNGTPFEFAQETETTVTDVLPEEQAIIQREESVTTQEADEAEEEAVAVSEESAEPIEEEPTEELSAESEPEENEETTFEENQPMEDSASASQGEMIQGIKQPIAVEIYGD